MADTETEIVIQNDPVAPPTEVIIDKKAKSEGGKVITADEGVEDLKMQVARAKADSQARFNEAQRQIQAAHDRAMAAETEVATVRKGAVATVIDSLGKDREAARRDYKAAMEVGDFDKAGEANERMALAAARLVAAEQGKLELEEQAKRPNTQAQPVIVDNVEKLARSMGSKKSADWVRAHPEHVTNGALTPAVMSAHYSAIANGHEADSEDYFNYIDQTVTGRRQEREISRAPASAPVSRDVAQTPGSQRPGTVKLTASEVSTARALDMSLEDYARYKVELQKEGKIGRVAG